MCFKSHTKDRVRKTGPWRAVAGECSQAPNCADIDPVALTHESKKAEFILGSYSSK